MSSKPTILCVDDESHVVESMQLNLRKRYDVRIALSAQQGLDLLPHTPNVAVVVSDMRMPEMDGAMFLSKVRKVAPDATRILLTGYADIESAMRAVNDGQIFRFLTKPCSPPHLLATVAAGIEQHRLLTAERVLLQDTLVGSVKALVEVLSLVNPTALGRASRIRDRVRKTVEGLQLDQQWQVELAALLSQLGAVLLPEDTVRRLYDGEALDQAERRKLSENMETINRILGKIPRLEPVTAVLDELKELTRGRPGDERHAFSPGGRLLHAVVELDALEAQGNPLRHSLLLLAQKESVYGADVLAALESLTREPGNLVAVAVHPHALADGMVLTQDLKTADGVLILPRGFELNRSSREHIGNFADRLGKGEIKVLMAAEEALEPSLDAHPSGGYG